MNCLSFDRPTPTPCNTCDSCLGINRGDDIDVIEVDAASNTGVDNVRDIIENSRYRPARSRFKVYIIDEVHMLSKNAFNALLKTLEEPPEPREIHPRDDRAGEGAADDFVSLPAVRFSKHSDARNRQASAIDCRQRKDQS